MANAYLFRIEQPEARRIEVELSVEARGARHLDVRLPVWTPGSYLVREHQRHVDGFRAQDESGGELPVEKIDYAQAQDDYICFRCEGKEYLKEQTLAQLETSLDPAKFVRIHRSFVLNLDRLARVELDDRDNRLAILIDGRRLPVSRAGYTRLSGLLDK